MSRPRLGVSALLLAFGAVLIAIACETFTDPGVELARRKLPQPLSISAGGTGSGTVTSVPAGISCAITLGLAGSVGCSAQFPWQAVVTLTAVPGPGDIFAGWTGACSGTGSCVLMMTQARQVIASFARGPRTLTVTGAGTGSGSVASQAGLTPAISCTITAGTAGATGCSGNYPNGTQVTLTATAATGQAFAGWSGACTGIGTCQVSLDQTRNVTAAFAPLQFTLTVGGAGAGSGSVTSQTGLTPAINCTITAGSAGASGCSGNYTNGTQVTLTATPTTGGHSFTGWSGACTGTGTCQVTVTQASSVTASFAPPPSTLTVTGGGAGNGSVASQSGLTPAINCSITAGSAGATGCSGSYPNGTQVILTATAATGHSFSGWGGACTGTGSCQVTMNQARSVTATFSPPLQFGLTVTGSGTGSGSITSQSGLTPAINCTITGGTAGATGCTASYTNGTQVTLTATPATGGHSFTGWSGACTGTGTCQVTLDQARNVTAGFGAPQFLLTVAGGGAGNGSVASQTGLSPAINCTITAGSAGATGCSGSYPSGTQVTLTATAATGGHSFTGWSGACTGTGTCQITLDQARTVTASFSPPPSTLTVAGSGAGNGSVASQTGLTPAITCSITAGSAGATGCSASYPNGTQVTLTATAATGGHSFTGWSGACTGTGTCQVTMDQARSVTASFAPPPLTLTVAGGGTGNGSVASQAGLTPTIGCTITAGTAGATGCSASYPSGTQVTLTATASAGHNFTGWSGACTGTGTCQVTMDQVRSVTAAFAPIQLSLTVTGSGTGNGLVATQAGISPAIACTITGGNAGASGCSASYASGTAVTLKITLTVGYSFTGWTGACTGTGTCQVTMDQARTVTAGFSGGGAPAIQFTQGKWDPTFTTPIIAVHLHMLPTGKLLLWGRTTPYVWDPATSTFTQASLSDIIFCSGHDFLPDGRLLVAGGHITDQHGIPATNIFSPTSQSWTQAAPMAFGRWYPTVTPLEDGRLVVYGGTDQNAVNVPTPELWSGSSWTKLTGINQLLPFYPRSFVAPDGRIFYAGEGQPSAWLDPNAVGPNGPGTWVNGPSRVGPCRSYGSAVQYAPGKILYVGGCGPPVNTAETIDLNQANPTWTATASMTNVRRQLNATLLADGKVMVNGGTTESTFGVNPALAVKVVETWNPSNGSWTTWATEAVMRTYHGTTALLPDGRVVSMGSGDGGGVPEQFSGQVFNPPYLYNQDGTPATRPTIASVSTTHLNYGQGFTVQTPEAPYITKVNLIRLSSVTHAFNPGQMLYPVSFSTGVAGELNATAPANGRKAPPGPYMLVILNGNGVPSVAKVLTIGP